ncbi:MAG: hypothetical protein ACI865_002488 [Flavobacteriaceae bacterium]
MLTSGCKKEDKEVVVHDYREQYLGAYIIDYRYIAFEITNPAGADTIYESFVGQFVAGGDSMIVLSGASWGDLIYEVSPSGELIFCGGIDAGVIHADSVVTDYTVNGFSCAPMPNGWIQRFKFTGLR